MTRSCLIPVLIGLALLLPERGAAQDQKIDYQISQRGSISQLLGRTKVSLDYSRPLARNRADIFGKVVHWGELWTPGANMATTLEVDHEIRLNGHVVRPGKWSMWVIPSRVGPWELVLDARDALFHTQRPELTSDQVRVVIDVREDAPHTEALTWAFPRIAQDGATLVMNWLNLEIPLELEVESIVPASTVTAEDAARFAGEWLIAFEPMEERPTPPPAVLKLSHGEDGRLHAVLPPGAFATPADTTPGTEPDYSGMTPLERERAEARRVLSEYETGEWEYVLVPVAEGIFVMGWLDDDGTLLEASYLYHEFELENGRAARIVLRDSEDKVLAKGVRRE
jgi:hypothetical protein